jgi:hypothetical protein
VSAITQPDSFECVRKSRGLVRSRAGQLRQHQRNDFRSPSAMIGPGSASAIERETGQGKSPALPRRSDPERAIFADARAEIAVPIRDLLPR